MNLFQAIYCNQYEELVRTGRDGTKAHKNGIIIITVSIVVNIFSVVLILALLGKMGIMEGALRSLGSGRAAGKILAIVLLAVVGVFVWKTLGRQAYYEQTISAFNELNPVEQKHQARRGAVYFLGSIGVLIFLVMLSFILGK